MNAPPRPPPTRSECPAGVETLDVVFDGVRIDGERFGGSFEPRETERFVREFHRLKNRWS